MVEIGLTDPSKSGWEGFALLPTFPTALRKTNSGGCRLIKGVLVLRLKANATYLNYYLLFRDAKKYYCIPVKSYYLK